MLNNCTIWIGLPAFNEEKAIEKVLSSVLNLKKRIKKIKVIILNDGSKDDTLINAKKFKKKYLYTLLIIKKIKVWVMLYIQLFFFLRKKVLLETN